MADAGTIAAEILEAIKDQPIVDAHEHLSAVVPNEIKGFPDLIMRSYVRACLWAPTGFVNSLGEKLDRPLPTTWKEAAKTINQIRATSIWHWFERGVCELHGLGPDAVIDADTWDVLTDSIARAHSSSSWLSSMLDVAHIETVLWDPYWAVGTLDLPERRFRPSPRVDSAMSSFHIDASDYEGNNLIRDRAAEHGVGVGGLKDLEQLVDRMIEASVAHGAKSMKMATAYQRSIRLDLVSRDHAEAIFGTSPTSITEAEKKAFGDYMLSYQIERAIDCGLVLQIHTGMARLADSNPLNLIPLLQRYPNLVVDLFHGGYPWVREFGALSHSFPNVRLNLVWLPQLTATGAIAALKEWIQMVPQISRLAWGGDCRTPEEAYGALIGGKATISRALGELIADGYLRFGDGLRVARSILYDGAMETYRLAS